MMHARTTKCRPATVFSGRSKSFASLQNRLIHAKVRLTTSRRGSGTEPRFIWDSFTTWRMIPWSPVPSHAYSPM